MFSCRQATGPYTVPACGLCTAWLGNVRIGAIQPEQRRGIVEANDLVTSHRKPGRSS